MKPDILRQYPLVKKYFDQQRSMGIAEPETVKKQERAIELIAAEGGGEPAEKEASMICAALILNPMALYIDVGRFWEGYSEDVGNVIQSMLSTAPNSFMAVPLAQGTAAAGIIVMEDVLKLARAGKPLGGSPQDVFDGLKQAYGQEMENFAYLEAPVLLARYETTRDTVFAEVEAKITPAEPPATPPSTPPKRQKPGNGNFEF